MDSSDGGDAHNSPAMSTSQLKQLLGEEESPHPAASMEVDEEPQDNVPQQPTSLIDEPSPLRKTRLGLCIDEVTCSWGTLFRNVADQPPIPPPSGPEHVKELAETCVKQFRDSLLDLNSEFTRIALQWEYNHPESVHAEQLVEIQDALDRQDVLLERSQLLLEKRSDLFFNQQPVKGAPVDMWHEARRQEKALRAKMVDCSKRAERRRRYYENVRRDPDQFMQVHGRRCQIHTDRNIAKAAGDSNILRKWQGDPDILIDRFDARSHLDMIPPASSAQKLDPDSAAAKEEIVCDFERYRLLVINEFLGVSEKTYLRRIAEKEYWLTGQTEEQRKEEMEKKKKSADTKAAINFSYGDEVVGGRDQGNGSDSDEEEPQDIGVDLDLSAADAEAHRRASKLGEDYGIGRGMFPALMKADQRAQKDAAELRRIERQKNMLAGREGRQEREMLKRQRQLIVGKSAPSDDATMTLLSFVEKPKTALEESSSSESDCGPETSEFITTFGDEDDEEEAVTKKCKPQGPQLPSEEYRRILSLASKREASPDIVTPQAKQSSSNKSRRSVSRERRRSTSRSRRRSTSRTRRRSRSRSRDRSRYSGRRSSRKSRSRSKSRDRNRRSRSRERRRSRDRKKRQRSSSSSKSPNSKDRPMFGGRQASDDESAAKRSRSKSKSESESEGLLELRSSMSESEKERIEIENRKRRVKRTKKMVKENKNAFSREAEKDSDEEEKKEIARKMKLKMKRALRQTVEDIREEEEEKKREAERERRVREELLFLEDQERKERERERRRREDESGSSSAKRRRSRSRSNSSSDNEERRYRR